MEQKLRSEELVSQKEFKELWDKSVPFPSVNHMPDLDIVTHVSVERATPNGYHFLLEATIAHHKGLFYAAWANHRKIEEKDNKDCIVRGCTSKDGLHWTSADIWMEYPTANATSFNHPLLFSNGETLYAFVAAWYDDYPRTHIFTYNEEEKVWDIHEDSAIMGFVPFCAPQKMEDGNWIISGSKFWDEAAVAISEGDDFSRWNLQLIPKNKEFKLMFPESSIIKQENKITIICRPWEEHGTSKPTCGMAESFDCGKTWSELSSSNFPMIYSMPYAGRLSSGENYLLSNSLEEGRFLLSVAITDKNSGKFNRIFKIRHQMWPARREFEGYNNGVEIGTYVGKPTEWSYPKAIEHDGNLYVIYAQGKEDCVLSIIPTEVLKDKEF